jgi:hypothetical protein
MIFEYLELQNQGIISENVITLERDVEKASFFQNTPSILALLEPV